MADPLSPDEFRGVLAMLTARKQKRLKCNVPDTMFVTIDGVPLSRFCVDNRTGGQRLTLAHFTAQLEYLRKHNADSELNLSTFGPHPRVNSGYIGDKVSLS